MVWNISLVSLDQLSWLCSLSTSFPPPTYSLEGRRVRNIEGLDTGQTWMSNSQDTGVLEALNFLSSHQHRKQPSSRTSGGLVQKRSHAGLAFISLDSETCSPWRTTVEQAPGRNCCLWRQAHAGAGFLAGPVACGGPTQEQSIPEGLYPVERIHYGAVCGER